ncbi:MAG: hypothetical protein HRU26_05745 [Psychroserpens sp.]|nr:hypothetical protein [Psychroserpens sp.]
MRITSKIFVKTHYLAFTKQKWDNISNKKHPLKAGVNLFHVLTKKSVGTLNGKNSNITLNNEIMKQLFTFLLIPFLGFAQVETQLTNYLNLPCNATVCQDIQLGACPGDLQSDGTPVPFTDYYVYYVTEPIDIQYNSLTLRNCRLEFRNGAFLIDNGIEINFQNDCDTEEDVTGFVFIGGGAQYPSWEVYYATLSIQELEQQGVESIKEIYYDLLGKQIDINYASKGLYLKRSFYPYDVVKTTKIIN